MAWARFMDAKWSYSRESVTYVVGEAMSTDGVGAHVAHKCRIVESLPGGRVRRYPPTKARKAYTASVLVKGMVELCLDRSVCYARAGRNTLILLLPRIVLGGPTVLELNGFLRARGQTPARPSLPLWLLRRLARRSNVVVAGDSAWIKYALDSGLATKDRTVCVPLWLDLPERSDSIRARRTVLFAGSDQPWQPVSRLVDAFLGLESTTWQLHLLGPPSLAQYEVPGRVEWRGQLGGSSAEFASELWSAGVLATCYDVRANEGVPISSLKSVQYLQTDRPTLLCSADTVRSSFAESDERSMGVFLYSTAEATAELASALHDAIELFEGQEDGDWKRRKQLLVSGRGPQRQRSAISEAAALAVK